MLFVVQQKEFKSSQEGKDVGTFSLVYYNAIVGLPICIVVALVTGEFSKVAHFPALSNPSFLAGLSVSSAAGVLITYATMLCNTYNSPLATSVTGNTKDVLTTVVSMYMFSDFDLTVMNASGLLVSFSGAGAYAYFSYKTLKTNEAAAAATAAAAKARADDPLASLAQPLLRSLAEPLMGALLPTPGAVSASASASTASKFDDAEAGSSPHSN